MSLVPIPPAVAEFAVLQLAGRQAAEARSIRYGAPHVSTVHRVEEWTTGRGLDVWIDGQEWGVTLRTTDGHDVEIPADAIRDYAKALDAAEPMPCARIDCDGLADPTNDDQRCVEHGTTRRWP